MSFKDEYKKSYDDIVPDQKFIKQLSEKMNQEQQKRQKISYRVLQALVSIVLILFAGFSAFWLIGRFSQPSKPLQVHTGKSLPAISSEPGTFASDKWYDADAGPEEILSVFLERLGDKEQLVALYQSTENDFAKEQAVSETEIRQMIEKLRTAEPVSEEQSSQPDGNYYMAEFQNGDIVKFVITADGYFHFLDLDYIYQYQK